MNSIIIDMLTYRNILKLSLIPILKMTRGERNFDIDHNQLFSVEFYDILKENEIDVIKAVAVNKKRYNG